MNRIFCAVLLAFNLCSCAYEKEIQTNDPLTLFEEIEDLKGELIELDKELLGLPGGRVVQLDSILVVYDVQKANDKFLFVIDVKNGKLLKKIVDVGWGPCEFSLLRGIKTYNDGQAIHLMDPNKKQLFELLSREILVDSIKRPCPELITTFTEEGIGNTSFTDVIKVDENYLLGFGSRSSDSMFTVLSSSGKVIKNTLSFPILEGNYANKARLANQIYFGQINKQPNGSKIACVASPGLLGIFNFSEGNLNVVRQFETLKPSFGLLEERIIKDKDAKIGYSESWVTRDNIYIGYCSTTYMDAVSSGNNFNCDFLLAFDWDGNPTKCYKLDYPIDGFAVNEKTKTLFGITNTPEPKVVKYELEKKSQ